MSLKPVYYVPPYYPTYNLIKSVHGTPFHPTYDINNPIILIIKTNKSIKPPYHPTYNPNK